MPFWGRVIFEASQIISYKSLQLLSMNKFVLAMDMHSHLLKLQMCRDQMIDISEIPDLSVVLPKILHLQVHFYLFYKQFQLLFCERHQGGDLDLSGKRHSFCSLEATCSKSSFSSRVGRLASQKQSLLFDSPTFNSDTTEYFLSSQQTFRLNTIWFGLLWP